MIAYLKMDVPQYLFLCRVPILAGITIFSLPILVLMLKGGLTEAMLGNVFVLRGWPLFFTAGTVVIATWSIRIVWRIMLVNAPPRYAVPAIRDARSYSTWRRWSWPIWLIIMLPTLIILIIHTEHQHVLVAPLIVLAAIYCSISGLALLPLVFSPYGGDWYLDHNAPARAWALKSLGRNLPSPLFRGIPWLSRPLPPRMHRYLEGYLDESGRLGDAHVALFTLLVGLGVYFVLAGLFLFRPGRMVPPTLVSLFILISISTIVLGALTFFLDRFRVPLFVTLAVVSWTMYWLFNVDHYFLIRPQLQRPVSLSTALRARTNTIPQTRAGKTMVLVAASGGGIQAGMWTTQVLVGLEEQYEGFADSIAVLSTVSGGSVGTLFYLDRFAEGGRARNEAVTMAGANSLHDVGWGLLYPDLARVTIPLVPNHIDRGWALEESWRSRLRERDATFGTWRARIQAGQLPIPVFNATVVETGERLLLTPVSLPSTSASRAQLFDTLYPSADVGVATAARLSATFPYVTPMARADAMAASATERSDEPTPRANLQAAAQLPPWHIADGGYYDNYGVMTLVEWLHDVIIPDTQLSIDHILLIQIRLDSTTAPPRLSGWVTTSAAPLFALYNVRGATQRARNKLELELLQAFLDAECKRHFRCLSFSTVVFTYQGENVLSWALSRTQQTNIQTQWRAQGQQNAKAFEHLDTFFARNPHPQ